LGLRGVNNLDYVLHGGLAQLLELNPRPSATLGLYEGNCPGGWMRRHVHACLGELPELPLAAPTGVSGQRVVYAPQSLSIPFGIRWPDWCHDRPLGGIQVQCGAPLCTVSAGGATAQQAERRLRARERDILGLIDPRGVDERAAAVQ
jgi:predicted ATP-grasp superfamily ATP-dependent carboligase